MISIFSSSRFACKSYILLATTSSAHIFSVLLTCSCLYPVRCHETLHFTEVILEDVHQYCLCWLVDGNFLLSRVWSLFKVSARFSMIFRFGHVFLYGGCARATLSLNALLQASPVDINGFNIVLVSEMSEAFESSRMMLRHHALCFVLLHKVCCRHRDS